MARPKDLIAIVVDALRDSGNLPSSMNYVGYEPNIDTDAIKLPLLEVDVVSEARIDSSNTDVQGYIEDDAGNRVGRVFHALYNLTLEVNVWTAQGSKHDPKDLGDTVYATLYKYDDAGPGDDLSDDVWRVRLGDGETDDDFTTSPTLRRWSQQLDLWAFEEFTTDEDYITGVDYPDA